MITVFSRSGTDDERAVALLTDFRRVPRARVQKFVRTRLYSVEPSRFTPANAACAERRHSIDRLGDGARSVLECAVLQQLYR
jgi:hypothetical protein